MAKWIEENGVRYQVVDGIKYAEGVEPADDGEEDPELLAALTSPAKIRITTMVDEDIYDELKRRAGSIRGGRYQTLLNLLLRQALFGKTKGKKITFVESADDLNIDFVRHMDEVVQEWSGFRNKLVAKAPAPAEHSKRARKAKKKRA